MAAEAAAPLLAREDGTGAEGRSGGGVATWAQTLGNLVVSIVGTGVLGLPYAFRTAGWLAGSLGVAAAGCATLYCMLLLVSTLPYRPTLHYCIYHASTALSVYPASFSLFLCPYCCFFHRLSVLPF
jgi:proton-coupled amino acid transporter